MSSNPTSETTFIAPVAKLEKAALSKGVTISRFESGQGHHAGIIQLEECHVANVDVVGSNPTTCSKYYGPDLRL